MITLFSGTPGSGKSYHACKVLYDRMSEGGGIICNFPLAIPSGMSPKKELRVSYWDNSDITPIRFFAYARQYHAEGLEGQTLVVVDEAQVVWNSRSFTDKHRMEWVKFFSQHRKLGFDLILIAQNDRMLDKQIRMLIEYEVKHRKLNNYGVGGAFFCVLTGMATWFVAIEYWYGGNKLQLSHEMIKFNSKIAKLYDSYRMFSGGMETTFGIERAKALVDQGMEIVPVKHKRFLRIRSDETVDQDAAGPADQDAACPADQDAACSADQDAAGPADQDAAGLKKGKKIPSLPLKLSRPRRIVAAWDGAAMLFFNRGHLLKTFIKVFNRGYLLKNVIALIRGNNVQDNQGEA